MFVGVLRRNDILGVLKADHEHIQLSKAADVLWVGEGDFELDLCFFDLLYWPFKLVKLFVEPIDWILVWIDIQIEDFFLLEETQVQLIKRQYFVLDLNYQVPFIIHLEGSWSQRLLFITRKFIHYFLIWRAEQLLELLNHRWYLANEHKLLTCARQLVNHHTPLKKDLLRSLASNFVFNCYG